MASPPPPWANSQPLVEPYAAAAAPWLTHGTPAPGSSPAPTSDMPPPSAAPSPQVASAASDGKPKKPRKPRPKKDPAAGAGAGANARAGSSTATPAPGALADAAAAAGDEGASGGRKPKKKATKKATSRAGSVSTRAGSVARATPAAAVGEGDARHEGEGTPAPPTTAAGQQLEAEQRQRQQRGTVEESSDDEEEDEEDEGALDAQDLESIERSHERKKGEIGALMQLMSPAQYDRHEAFQRTGLSKPDVRRLVNHVLSQSITPQLSTLFAAAGKVFIGEMVEEARRVAAAQGHVGALQPSHLAAAFAAHKERLERPGAQAPGAVAKGGAPGTGKRRRMF